MLKKLFEKPKQGMSDEDYANLMRYQFNFFTVFLILLSCFLFASSFLVYYFYGHKLGSFTSGLYSGIFGGAIGIKLTSMVYLSNPTTLHRKKIAATDERIQTANQYADAFLLKIIVVIAYLAFVLSIFFTQYIWYLLAPLTLIFILQLLLRWFFKKIL